MKNILFIAFVVLSMTLLLLMQLDSENQIEEMHKELNNYENIIDSLYKEIDTLNNRLEIYDFVDMETNMISALIFVESSGNDSAYNASEDAVGCLQIRKTMVDDINRILKNKIYTYSDRWNRTKSIEMLKIYCNHYNLNTPEHIARCWNGGPRGLAKPQTVNYWSRVKNKMEENS
jgi:hypothetical protein|tara:strand:+ start:30 stop:554 length:525 start_codon:yes stop_codon:yes gene_type:complete